MKSASSGFIDGSALLVLIALAAIMAPFFMGNTVLVAEPQPALIHSSSDDATNWN